MILTCPACRTRYVTDAGLIGGDGRRVRCAKCGHIWMQMPPSDLPRLVNVPPPPLPPLSAMQAGAGKINLPARYDPSRRLRRRLRVALSVAAVLVLVIGIGGYVGRDRIVATWPSAQRVYDLIGDLVGESRPTVEYRSVDRSTAQPRPRG